MDSFLKSATKIVVLILWFILFSPAALADGVRGSRVGKITLDGAGLEILPVTLPEKRQHQSEIEFRLRVRLLARPAEENWSLEIGSQGRVMKLNQNSVPAADGSFLTPVLNPDDYYFYVPAGAPGFKILNTLYVDSRASVLSTIDTGSRNSIANFSKVSDVEDGTIPYQLGNPEARANLTRVARAMIWFAIEDDVNNEQSACTGFLITTTLALTNDHCVRPTTSNKAGQIGLIRAWLRDRSRQRKEAPTVQRVQVEYLSKIPEKNPDERLDFSVLRLPELVPSDVPLKLAREVPINHQLLAVLQFPKNEPLVVNHDADCSVWGQGIDYLVHGCDTDYGSSGSPVIDRALNRGVYALHFLGHENDETMGNRALPIPALLAEVRKNNEILYQEIYEFQEALK